MDAEPFETEINAALNTAERQVRGSQNGRMVRLCVRMAAPAERVWEACSDRDLLRRWFADVKGDLREGSELTFDVGAPCQVTSRILRCEPGRQLIFTWSYPGVVSGEVEFVLTAEGEGTVIELEHRSEDGGEWWLGAGSGWEYALIRLGFLLRGDDPAAVSAEELDERLGPLWAAAGKAGS